MGGLRRRLPVRVRQNWRPVSALAVGLGVLLVCFGDYRVSPWVTSASDGEGEQIIENIPGTVDLYDPSVPHEIRLSYDEDAYAEMIEDFRERGEKNHLEADLTIDGTFIESVGLRLKGNSTLQGLRSDGPGEEGAPPDPGTPPGLDGPPDQDGGRGPGEAPDPQPDPGGGGEQALPAADGTAAGSRQDPAPDPADGGTAGGADGGAEQDGEEPGIIRGFGGIELSPDKPEELPWLISIDEYVEGRAYQGHQEISVRPGTGGELPLNEALSLSLMAASGQPAERFAFSSFTVQDRPATTRLLVENPGPSYAAAAVGTNGVLYKARAESRFTYRGEDPTAYEEDFEQLTKLGSQDLQPVIDLIRWVEEADDEEFAAELSEHVDVSSFAEYVATQNLLLNSDDMAGPGRNYLLWYDLDTRKFSVLGWDFNLAFSGNPALGPEESTTMGGAGPQVIVGPDEGTGPGEGRDGGPEVRVPGPDEGRDGGPEVQGPGPDQGQEGGPEVQGPGPGGSGEDPGGVRAANPLKERFLELDAFDEVYADAYRELHQCFYASGTAVELLDTLAGQAAAAGADGEQLDTAVAHLRDVLTERAAALAEAELISGSDGEAGDDPGPDAGSGADRETIAD